MSNKLQQEQTPENDRDNVDATADATDTSYDELRQKNRVVMRHNIARNIDSFRASTEDFAPRPERTWPDLQENEIPFMSVIVPNYNGIQFLEPLLDGLFAQSFRDFELIFADDASSDNSVAFVESRYTELRAVAADDADDVNDGSSFPALRILVNRHNQGFVSTCNKAAAAAQGRILVLLNNDTEPEADWLAALARAMCAHPQAALVTSKVLLFDERSTLHTTGDLLGKDGIPRNRGVWEEDRGQYDAARQVFSGSGCGTAYRRDVWETLGGFDEDFWMYLEDVDYGFRAQLLGWQSVYEPGARVYHRLSATSGHTLASFYVGRNTIWTIVKNMPSSLLRRNLLSILKAQLSVAVDALRNIRGAAARARLRGQWAGIVSLPDAMQKRAVIQERRLAKDAEIRKKLV